MTCSTNCFIDFVASSNTEMLENKENIEIFCKQTQHSQLTENVFSAVETTAGNQRTEADKMTGNDSWSENPLSSFILTLLFFLRISLVLDA